MGHKSSEWLYAAHVTVASAPRTDRVQRQISIPITSTFQFITGVQTAEDVQG